MINLNTLVPGHNLIAATKVSNSSTIIGTSGTTTGTDYFCLTGNQHVHDLGTIQPIDINSKDEIIAIDRLPNHRFLPLLLRIEGDSFIVNDLTAELSWCIALNEKSKILGRANSEHGFVYVVLSLDEDSNSVIELECKDQYGCTPSGLNSFGYACGIHGSINIDATPCIWNPDGTLVELPHLGRNWGEAMAINDFGIIVGTCDFPLDLFDRLQYWAWMTMDEITRMRSFWQKAVIWRKGEIVDLEELTIGMKGFSILNVAKDINNEGVIVGWGTKKGATRGFVLKPVK